MENVGQKTANYFQQKNCKKIKDEKRCKRHCGKCDVWTLFAF